MADRGRATPPRNKGAAGTRRQGGTRSGGAARAKPPRPVNPRRVAYDVLAAVHKREAYANLLLPRLLADRGLAGRDAALATELTYGTLRGQGSYDAVLAACSDRPLDKLDPPVLLVLRLGTHQLLSTRVGAHAAVATSVDLAKSVGGPRISGYVNAVLRRVATRDMDAWLEIIAPRQADDPDGNLAIRYSHPRWVVDAYRAALGAAADAPFTAADGEVTELEAALAAGNARPRVTLATFPAGPGRDQVMPEGAEPGRWSEYAFTLASGDPGPLTAGGRAAVQDEGSQLAAIALSRAPVAGRPADEAGKAGQTKEAGQSGDAAGECWLDLCAGPGGKSRLLYGLAAERGARLVAAELHPHRAALVRQALSAASTAATVPLPGFAVLAADGTRPAWPEGGFDRVLADVPCSGLGALRRRPEARWRKSPADLPALAGLQRDLLAAALAAVRPGGVVAYVTCSPVPAETTEIVAAVAAEAADVSILDAPTVLSWVPEVRSPGSQCAQLWPHRHGTDAIFIALLRRAEN